MRASQVREALEAAVQGITPDPPTYLAFKKLDAKGREVSASVMERTFTVTLGQIPRRSAVGFESANWWMANFDMQLFYSASDDVEDRIAGDFERIITRMTTFHTDHDDIMNTTVAAGAVQSLSDGLLTAAINIDISYRLTGV
jgi:hypothetical protein